MAAKVLMACARSTQGWQRGSALPFRLRRHALGLHLIAVNLDAPTMVLDRASREGFAQLLERERFDLVGIGFGALDLAAARDFARLVRLVQPQADLVVGGPGASLVGIEKAVECDGVIEGDGVAGLRHRLGEDQRAPVHLPPILAAAQLTGAGRVDLALLVAGAPDGASRRCFFEDGEALFAEACRQAQALGTESFFVPDEDLFAAPELVRGFGRAMEREQRAFELIVCARAADLGMVGVQLACQGAGDARLVKALREQGIAVEVSCLLTADGPDEAIEDALALQADSIAFLPRFDLAQPAERLLERSDESWEKALGQVQRARAIAAERNGHSLFRLAQTLAAGYRAFEFSDDPWLRRRAAQERTRVEDLRELLPRLPAAHAGAAERELFKSAERDFACLIGPEGLGRRAAAMGGQALKGVGGVVRRVQRVVSQAAICRYRWGSALQRVAQAARRRRVSHAT